MTTFDTSHPTKQKRNMTSGKKLIIFAIVALFFQQMNLPLSSLGIFVVILQFLLNLGVLYLFVLWIIDRIRRRGGIDRPENKKAITITNLIFIILILGSLVPFLIN